MKLSKIQPIKARIKRPEIVETLTKLARELGPGTRLPRTRELSKALGVTLATLDQGLRQLDQRGFIERRPRSGIFVSPRILQRAVGMVLGWDIFSSRDAAFYAILLDRCAKRAASQKERFSFFLDLPATTHSGGPALAHQDLVDALAAGKLDGLLVASIRGDDQDRWLRSQGVPVVSLDFGGGPHSVTVDIEAVTRMAAKKLKESGCRTVALMTPVSHHADYFRRAAKEVGLSFEESWVLEPQPYDSDSHVMKGAKFARRLVDMQKASPNGSLPDGIIICDDVVALGACPYFASHDIAIGKDLKIASHSNKGSLTLADWESVLIRCEIDPEEIAEAMFSMLQILMQGGTPTRNVIRIQPHLRTA